MRCVMLVRQQQGLLGRPRFNDRCRVTDRFGVAR